MFAGVSTLNLDAKGRLAVPAKHRETLADCCASRVVVTVNPDDQERCLLLYPENEWREVARNLSRRDSMHPKVRAMQRLVVGYASELELDGQGRYKVKMPFDLSGRQEGKASHWLRMVQPYAGTDHGMHFPLHKGTEVLLTFVEGDPDRPIIAGAVPNPEKPSVINDEKQLIGLIKLRALADDIFFHILPEFL